MDELREIYIENIDSTNLWAKNNIETLVDRTVVFAGAQTQGRGRLQRNWVDLGKGNLFMSLVLKPSEKFDEHYANLTQYMSVSLCKVLETYGLKPEIKWPNDVLISGKKIAGILSEASVRGTTFKGLVLGIGVNLNAKEEDFAQIDKAVTALNLELGREIDLKEFKTALVEEFFKNYETFLSLGFEFIKKDYLTRANFLDKELCVALINETKRGVAKGVTDNGELILCSGEQKFILNIGDIL
ncbi:MAG: biotin--[acetyl-CoA-carboxylase] ligase [Fusobacterium sp.]|nr:biotin--[acetyl-CoA-carboxylase] ligase [Fusobacterium sp.]